jgi:predicted Zn-dependent protease
MKLPSLFLCAAFAFGQTANNRKARALGEELANQIEKGATVVDDGAVSAYITNLARALSAPCGASEPAEVHVLLSDQANGSALPGAILFVNTGLIRHARSEAELAEVLAHLIVRSRSAAPVQADVASIPIFLRADFQPANAGPALPAGLARYYSAAVLDADRRAVSCVAAAGYDPEEFVQDLEPLLAPPASLISGAAGYPAPAERAAAARGALRSLPANSNYVVSSAAFAAAKARVESLYSPKARSKPSLESAPSLAQ